MIRLNAEQRRRLADAARHRRRELGDPAQGEVARRGGISLATYQKLETGAEQDYMPRSIDALDAGLLKPSGWAQSIVDGTAAPAGKTAGAERPWPAALADRIAADEHARELRAVLDRLLDVEPAKRAPLLDAIERMVEIAG